MTLQGHKNHYNVKFLRGYGVSINIKKNKIRKKVLDTETMYFVIPYCYLSLRNVINTDYDGVFGRIILPPTSSS